MSHPYWANFWVHKRVRVPKYGSRFPSTGPILGIYLGPGSRVRVQVPEYGNGLAQYQWLIRYISKSNENLLKEIILYKTELKLHKWLFSNVEITKPCNNNYIHDVTSMDGILSCHVHCHFSQPELNVALKVSRLQIMYFSDLF